MRFGVIFVLLIYGMIHLAALLRPLLGFFLSSTTFEMALLLDALNDCDNWNDHRIEEHHRLYKRLREPVEAHARAIIFI